MPRTVLGKDRGDKSKALASPPSCFWSIGEAEGCIAVQKELECWQRPVHSESRGGVHGSDDGRGVTVKVEARDEARPKQS